VLGGRQYLEEHPAQGGKHNDELSDPIAADPCAPSDYVVLCCGPGHHEVVLQLVASGDSGLPASSLQDAERRLPASRASSVGIQALEPAGRGIHLFGPALYTPKIVHLPLKEIAVRDEQWKDRTLIVRVHGTVTKDAVVKAVRALTSDSRYDAVQFVLADFLDAEWSDSSFLEILEDVLATLIGASLSNPNVRFAVIAHDPYIVELADALARFEPNRLLPIRTFTCRESAMAWLAEQTYRSRPSMRFRPR